MYELIIENNGVPYQPLIEGEVIWTTERTGVPGKLEFNVVKDEVILFEEGDSVRFKVNGVNVFFGYVWEKSRNKEQIIKVIAYDQLRYFKYKDTYKYIEKKASDVLKMLAAEQGLKVGKIDDTGYVIAKRLREDKTLFDIVYDALNLTLDNTKKLYVLYDDFGRITLENMESMNLDLIVNYDNTEDFDYKTTLDGVYNQIKLTYKNEKTGKKEVYVAKDSENINRWGKLQYFEKIDEKTHGVNKANTLLELFNRKSRTLEIKNTVGDVRVRAGTSLIVNLPDIGDISIQNYMLVDSAKHVFSNNEHFMNLLVRGRI